MKRKEINGTVHWFNEEKGWGFVLDEDGNSYFAHTKKVKTKDENGNYYLKENQKVRFQSSINEKNGKPYAYNIYVE